MRGAAKGAVAGAWLAAAAACAPPTLVLGLVEGSTSGIDSQGTTAAMSGAQTGDGSGSTGLTDPCGPDGAACVNKIDLLFVIDNSGTMGEEQLNLARNFPLLIEQLQTLTDLQGKPAGADVNIMVTTTDFGNPACSGQLDADYVPAAGRPIRSPCTERLSRFTGLGPTPLVIEEACTDVCDPDAPAAPTDQFIHFSPTGDNVPQGTPSDALACLGPQGIDGCGFEGTLESMAQALDPTTCWNDPDNCSDEDFADITQPFLRDDAVLAIAIITDEADCSVQHFPIMDSDVFWEVEPVSGRKQRSSALCWNAGVVCSDLDPITGEYAGCIAANKTADGSVGVPMGEPAALQPLSRYATLLAALKGEHDKEIIMLGVLGVPEVTERAPDPPYQPIAGGVRDLVYRNWRDPDVDGGGDILPDEWAAGVTAADKQAEFGIGPGCTGTGEGGMFTGQAVPPVRIREVCESLNVADDPDTLADETKIRCCIESICDDDFSPAIRCLTDLIQNVFTPVG